MATPALSFQEIVSLDDDLLEPVLDLYQTAFPLNEQVRVSSFVRALRRQMRGEPPMERFVCAVDGDGRLAGLAITEAQADVPLYALWYLAVVPEMRCAGVGARLYAEVVRRARVEALDARAVLLEVEVPEEAETPELRDLASRRIGFYRRNGALLLGGVDYTLSVGWQPPVPMHLVFHPLSPLTPSEAYDLSSALFGEALRRTGDLTLG